MLEAASYFVVLPYIRATRYLPYFYNLIVRPELGRAANKHRPKTNPIMRIASELAK
jgi:hypothetical protein